MLHTSVSLLEQLRIRPDEATWRRLDELCWPLICHGLLRDPSLRDEARELRHRLHPRGHRRVHVQLYLENREAGRLNLRDG